MDVWRIKLNSGRHNQGDHAKAYCREASVVGVGWGRPETLADGALLEEVIAAVSEIEDWLPTGPTMIKRLARTVHDGDLMWTRDRSGGFWLGRIEGPYRYDASDVGTRWDLNNVRPCQWLQSAFRDYEIPGGVVRSFAGRGATLQRVKEPAAVRVTEMLWRRESGDPEAWRAMSAEEVISGLLDPTDVEDLVLLHLQLDGWLLLPSSRMHDTPIYEAALRRPDGQLAVVSVKSGSSAPVRIARLAAAAADGGAQAFAYSTHKRYTELPADHGVVEIRRDQLVALMADHQQVLPPRIAQWLSGEPVASRQ